MKRVIETSIGQPRKHSGSSFILIAIFASGFFALLPLAQAVVPAPDGGYPGFNTAEGTNALKNLTTGVGNAAVGWYSLFSNTDGSYNTGVGTGTLLFNTAFNNTAFGAAALCSTLPASPIQPSVALHSRTTTGTTTRRSVFKRSLAVPAEAGTCPRLGRVGK